MPDRPNILFLLNDHQAFYGHGPMAGGPPILRPHFDRLAAQGAEFLRAYAACPLCGPVRRTMLTGLYPHNHGEIRNDRNKAFDTTTYLDILANTGYQNYYYGKWHAGPGTAFDHQCQGFSYPSYNNPYTKPEYQAYLKQQGLPQPRIRPVYSFMDPARGAGFRFAKAMADGTEYVQDGAWCNEHAAGVMTTPKETQESFFLAHMACEQLRRIAAQGTDQPFHLRVDFWGPHQPYFPCREFADLYDPAAIPVYPSFHDDLSDKPEVYKREWNYPIGKDDTLIHPNPVPWEDWQKVLALCYAQITMIDEAGGLILDALHELGLTDNTLVVWGTDHGDNLACHGGHFDKRGYMPEEMLRVPMALSYSGHVAPGQKRPDLVSNMDIPFTFLEAAGAAFPHAGDGASLLPLVSGSDTNWRDDLMCETHGHGGDHLGRILLTGRYKYVWNAGDRDELYDLAADPYELRNLDGHPGCAAIRQDMVARLTRWRVRTNDHPERPDSPWQRILQKRPAD